ncbi:MAG: FdtA/QdtA family cupin domain-containing protein [Paramuribaculum sp.]|nr:FdtA/QdtA family cupin domain-containing protein [Paramuribaculum sp.]
MSDYRVTTVDDCRIITLASFDCGAGKRVVAENSDSLPFSIKRVIYIYDLPFSAERGGHSHKVEQGLIMAACGCFDVKVSDGHRWRTFTLRQPDKALYIPVGIWRVIDNFSSGSVVLSLKSTDFDEDDYIREYDRFVKTKK